MTDVAASSAVFWFDDVHCQDVKTAGGKGASLARMTHHGLPVPPGFVIPAHVLEDSVDANVLRQRALTQDHAGAQRLVRTSSPPRAAIEDAYQKLGGEVAVRSSATAEDSDAASYAGQQETYLNVAGVDNVCRAVVECWASFFSERAIFYRERKGSLDDLGMAVVVQKMLAPVKSGVMFTIHPISARKDRMVIEGVFGLGEQVVSGQVTPDHYVVDRSGMLKKEHLVHGGVLDRDELARLAELGRQLEEYFGSAQDVEWAIADDTIYLLQSRPVTTR